jgi:hypothetical protein
MLPALWVNSLYAVMWPNSHPEDDGVAFGAGREEQSSHGETARTQELSLEILTMKPMWNVCHRPSPQWGEVASSPHLTGLWSGSLWSFLSSSSMAATEAPPLSEPRDSGQFNSQLKIPGLILSSNLMNQDPLVMSAALLTHTWWFVDISSQCTAIKVWIKKNWA